MAYLLLTLLALAVIAVLVFLGQTVAAKTNAEKKSLRRQVKSAESALRSIANGSGNPVLEAQIALDEITREKELVS